MNCEPILCAPWGLFSHNITMEAFTPTQYKTAKIHRIEHTPESSKKALLKLAFLPSFRVTWRTWRGTRATRSVWSTARTASVTRATETTVPSPTCHCPAWICGANREYFTLGSHKNKKTVNAKAISLENKQTILFQEKLHSKQLYTILISSTTLEFDCTIQEIKKIWIRFFCKARYHSVPS